MKKFASAATAALVLAAALASTAASAQTRPYGDRDRDGVPNAYDRHNNDRDRDGVPNRYDRHDNRRYWARHRYHGSRYVQPRHYRYVQYRVGAYLPRGYYGPTYYVDYRPYGLAIPPPGYRWARVGNDVYLVSTRNGLIRDVLYNLFY
jgi:Ni/Co efflux regulator RcnB